MKKKAYRAIIINKINKVKLFETVKDKKVTIGIDVAKTINFACLMVENNTVIMTIKWNNPGQSQEFVELIKALPASSVEIALEPSGTYGDPVRNLFLQSEIKVFRVSPKRSHDAAEVYDGVPSLHDSKSAAIIAKLHLDGASELWPLKNEIERNLSAVVNTMDMLDKQLRQNLNRLESQMARYWPEIGDCLDFDSATFLELVIKFGCPSNVTANRQEAEDLMKKVGGYFLKKSKIEKVISSVDGTIGIPMTNIERVELQALALRTRELKAQLNNCRKDIVKLIKDHPSIKAIGKIVGMGTSAVVISSAGDPLKYKSAQQWLRSLGLNLKEKSSGKYKGRLMITKRGSGKARHWLYFAVLRLIRHDAVVNAWYRKKVIRDGGIKMKAIVGIMRKLVLALWHVAHGKKFDTAKMFDTRQLQGV